MDLLLVEGDAALGEVLSRELSDSGIEVTHVSDGAHALTAQACDLVVLDTSLPDLDGRDVLRIMRTRSNDLPILVVSADDSEEARVLAFEAGADGWLARPFSVRELLVRLQALARRAGLLTTTDVQAISDRVRIDRRTRQVFLDDVEVSLTTTEFDLFSYLCRQPGTAYRRADIIEEVWDQAPGTTKTIDTHIANVRLKLDGALSITALRGVGFRVDTNAGSDASPI